MKAGSESSQSVTLNERRRAEVLRIVKECTDQLDALNYGFLSLMINRRTHRYLAEHYPVAASNA